MPREVKIQAISREERDELLDTLDKELSYWAEEERIRIEEEADLLKQIRKARTNKTAEKNLDLVSKVTADNINELLGFRVTTEEEV
jgi:hypothetical protein